MILQETLSATEILIGLLALLTQFIVVALVFGTLLYFFTIVYRIKEKTEASERLFWFRSFSIALIAVVIVIGIEQIFSILLFAPFFYRDIPVELLNAVSSTDIKGMITALTSSPLPVLALFGLMLVIIVAIMSYVMLGFYKVNFGWTTLLTWSAIGIFLLIDVTLSLTLYPEGLAGLLGSIGDSIRGLATV